MAKVLIDIPQQAYDKLKSDQQVDWLDTECLLSAIANGTLLSDNYTISQWDSNKVTEGNGIISTNCKDDNYHVILYKGGEE